MNIYIAFGSNQALGRITPRELIGQAADALEEAGVRLVARSSLWRSPAWPDPADPPYINAVAAVETSQSPEQLLQCLHAVEARFGRARGQRNAPRTLDLDLIDFNGLVLNDGDGLILPHPRAHQRAFVLAPLQEIAPGWTHPLTGEGVAALIDALAGDDIAATRTVAAFTAAG
ncbi:2-amino-4-hydroxy-6-hydroxymethyldihydropteridine diphosphokinase [Glycocaulis albus]|uniref:2-amino-4-hydroxy-6-hydroxymethyldihydropteridine pyrophosphokinase n=1 Tax=Glycocaulis albus TaxID=1382801 RepID=A0ABQ1XEZ9_9PROT|nr:2-amino-4-hydroxy-6-hydroxymethyldihydropteridine diphosphokinase [Glycocaulis albus]GGG92649.1 2-amino-4-hydroxy-6-hydroxymethyldihydropteridine diphosphokinase [Glycocaulis albus]